MKEYMEPALEAVNRASEKILHYYAKGPEAEWKADGTPVTRADREAEDLVREFLAKETPDCAFLGEESGLQKKTEKGNGNLTWVLDPIDGTKSFVCGVPLFGTLLALLDGTEPVVGVLDMPALGTRIWASKGQGLVCDGRPARASAKSELSKSVCLTGTVNTFEDLGWGAQLRSLRQSCWIHRGWGDCYGYYLVATGRAEIMVDPVVSLWDIAPMPLLFEEAGAVFCDLEGRRIPWDGLNIAEMGKKEFTGMACAPGLREEVLQHF